MTSVRHRLVGVKASAVGGFAVDGGEVTELSSSPTPLPANPAPFGIVVT